MYAINAFALQRLELFFKITTIMSKGNQFQRFLLPIASESIKPLKAGLQAATARTFIHRLFPGYNCKLHLIFHLP